MHCMFFYVFSVSTGCGRTASSQFLSFCVVTAGSVSFDIMMARCYETGLNVCCTERMFGACKKQV